MKKKVLKVVAIFSILIFLAGCAGNAFESLADEETKESCEYEISMALDQGDYDYVINTLEAPDAKCSDVIPDEEKYTNLAAAYVGKAGFDLNDVIVDLIDSGEGSDPFGVFVSALTKKMEENKGALNYLNKAIAYYGKVVDCDKTSSLDDFEASVCFNKGVVQLGTAAVSFAILMGGGANKTIDEVIQDWIGTSQTCESDADQDGVSDESEATACAIDYAATGSCSASIAQVLDNKTVSFYSASDSAIGGNYTAILIGINANGTCTENHRYVKLVDTQNNQTVLTFGFCKDNIDESCDPPDYNTLNSLATVDCWPCPVFKSANETYTAEEMVVDAINNSFDSVLNIIGANETVKETVEDIKTDVCGGDNCTLDEIKQYLISAP